MQNGGLNGVSNEGLKNEPLHQQSELEQAYLNNNSTSGDRGMINNDNNTIREGKYFINNPNRNVQNDNFDKILNKSNLENQIENDHGNSMQVSSSNHLINSQKVNQEL